MSASLLVRRQLLRDAVTRSLAGGAPRTAAAPSLSQSQPSPYAQHTTQHSTTEPLWQSLGGRYESTTHAAPPTGISKETRRQFHVGRRLRHGHIDPPKAGEERHVTFIDKDGDEHKFEVSDGDNLLDIAQAKDLEMEGACGGSCACSTCHVIVADEKFYDKMEEPSDDENDMLDLAFGLTETSRLGCQIHMSKDLSGLVVKLPSMTRNLQASDFKGKE